MKKFLIIITLILFLNIQVQAARLHSESSYQKAYCSQIPNAQMEYVTNNNARVDCLTDIYAIEFDFASKYDEGLGQALVYSYFTGKKPKIVLIVEKPKKELKYLEKVKDTALLHNVEIEIVTPKILKTNKHGKCIYKTCRGNRK